MKLLWIELKKKLSWNKIVLLAFVMSCFCLMMFSVYNSNKKSDIELRIKNNYTSGVGSAGFHDENEIEEAYSLWKSLFIERIDALNDRNFEKYNQITYEIASNEKINELPQYRNDYWISRNTEECEGKAVCLSEGTYQLPLPELYKYNLDHQVYLPEALQASDFLYKLVTEVFVFLVPVVGIYITYLFINQEKKEQSDKLTWTFPYPKFQIFISKVVSTFIVGTMVILMGSVFVYLFVGLMNGFHSSDRLLSLHYSRLFMGTPTIANEFVVMKQSHLNILLFMYHLFSLFISILITQFISLLFKNKKVVVLIAVSVMGVFPYLLSEYLQKHLMRKWMFLLLPIFSIYLPVAQFLQYELIQRDIVELSFSQLKSFTLMNVDYLGAYLVNMSLTQGVLVGLMTIGVVLVMAKLVLKRKDLI